MAIKKRKREWVMEMIDQSDIGLNIVSITNKDAVIRCRNENVKISLDKLPNKPTMNDVMTAVTRSYSNLVRRKK